MTNFFKLLWGCVMFISVTIHAQSIAINEVMASNSTTIADADNTYQDWVEIYNYGNTSVNLEYFSLSDDSSNPKKWEFPEVILEPNSYIIVWCSDKDIAENGMPLHTNFKISSNGEALYLYDAMANLLNMFPATAMGADVAAGRIPDGTGTVSYLKTPSPLGTNGTEGGDSYLTAPSFSHQSGFYTSGFNLTLSTTETNATILYTLDGSEPDEQNLTGKTYQYKNQYAQLPSQTTGSLLTRSMNTATYSSPINIVDRTSQANQLANISTTYHFNPDYFPSQNIFKGTVVKAKVIREGALDSPVVTKTFFIDPLGASKYKIPVVSLSANEEDLFGYEKGIFTAGKIFDDWRIENPTLEATQDNLQANYNQSGSAFERAAVLEYFEDGEEIINQTLGIRVNGGTSRSWQSKSIRLLPGKSYGKESLKHQFFPDKNVSTFHSLVLRNSGNDFFSTMYRDGIAQALIKDFNIPTQAYRPTITFINGEFTGILNLRERYDGDYFKNYYDIKSSELDLLENDLTPVVGDASSYESMVDFITNNPLSNEANFTQLKNMLAIDEFRDYFIANIYFDNTDWPAWNTIFWRKRVDLTPNAAYGQDGRWRPAFKDMDSAFSFYENDFNHDTLAFATATDGPSYPNSPASTLVLRSLLENTNFKNNFINRFADLLNSYLSKERIIALSEKFSSTIEPYINDHLERWSPIDRSWWDYSVDRMHDFATERIANQRQHILNKFGIDHTIQLTAAVSDKDSGTIKVNTIDLVSSTPGIPATTYPWTGVYFSEIPIVLKAQANPGYVFTHWSGAVESTNAEITITTDSDVAVQAHFAIDTSAAVTEPIFYWLFDDTLQKETPLSNIQANYSANGTGILSFESCIEGYPLTNTDENWRKGAMELREKSTAFNYLMSFNNDVIYELSDIKGIQIKQPFKVGEKINTLILNVPTTNYKDIVLKFAAVNEGAAEGLIVDYSINEDAEIWKTTGITQQNSLDLDKLYNLYTIDFSAIEDVEFNDNFKIRIRFTGDKLEESEGDRVTFNNISLLGVMDTAPVGAKKSISFDYFPNPAKDFIKISHRLNNPTYKIFSTESKVVLQGDVDNGQIPISSLSSGMYFLQITSEGITETVKVIKN